MMFRVGAIDAERMANSKNGGVPLPSLHSAFILARARVDHPHWGTHHEHGSAGVDEEPVNLWPRLFRA
jgi:hypothetical protein